MKNIKISVIVPIYKVERYLVQCIESILAQTLKDLEIILVDEGDIDACRAIIDMYEFGIKKDPRIKSIHEKNGGYGASVNKGIDIAIGEYISIIESDDFIEPTMYEEMYAYAKKLDADVVKTPYYEYKDATYENPSSRKICNYAEDMAKSAPANKVFSVVECPLIMAIHASLWSGIYKTSYIKENKIKFIAAKGGAYVDVGFRIDSLIHSEKIAWLDHPFYNYRLTNQDSTTNNFNLNAMILRWEEAHAKFKNYQDLYEKIGSYLFYDEFLNTFNYINVPWFSVNKDQLTRMHYLIQNISNKIISECPFLTEKDRRLLDIIRSDNYESLLKANTSSITNINTNKRDYSTFYRIYFLGIPLFRVKMKKNKKKFKILLFSFLPIFSIKF